MADDKILNLLLSFASRAEKSTDPAMKEAAQNLRGEAKAELNRLQKTKNSGKIKA